MRYFRGIERTERITPRINVKIIEAVSFPNLRKLGSAIDHADII